MMSWPGCKPFWSNRVEVVMLDDKTIQSAVARLVAAATSPSQVILFGSYARGTADEGSDLDLLVIEREIPNKADEYMRLRDALGRLAPDVGIDLLLAASARDIIDRW